MRTLLATLEQDAQTHQRESQQFDSLSVSAPVAQATTLARSGAYAARLNAGGSAPQPLGPLTQLGVQKGDTVTVSAFGYYAQPVQHGFFFTLGSFLAGLFHSAQAPPPGFEASKRKDLPLLQVGVAAGLASLPQLSGGVPKGYLRVLVFDKDSALVSQQTQQLTSAAKGGYEPLRLQVRLPQDGYVSAYVGNESDVDVLFDDVQVEHRPGLQVQENQYEPWGLSLAGLDYSTPGLLGLNKYQFNGKERQLDLGLGWADYGARLYDPARGPGWMSPDPLADKMRRWSPYTFSFDNPLRFMDPDGMAPLDWVSLGKQGVTFDPTVHDQAQATAKYGSQAKDLGKTALLANQGGAQVSLNADGTATASVPLPEAAVTGQKHEASALSVASTVSGAIGLSNDTHATIIGVAGMLDKAKGATLGFNAVNKTLGYIGKATGVVSALNSTVNAYNNPTLGNVLKAGLDVGLVLGEVNPIVAVGIGLLDATGVKDGLFQKLDQTVDTFQYNRAVLTQQVKFETIVVK